MPAWGEVFDQETIWELVNYVKTVIGAGQPAGTASNLHIPLVRS